MYRILLSLILISLLASSHALAQRAYPEVEKPKAKPKVKPKVRPRGPQVAANSANGVLFVLTDPPVAKVVIKSRGSAVRQGRSEDGQFRAELPPGPYDVEVTSENYKTFTAKALVKQAGTEPVDAELVPTTGSVLIGLVNVDTNVNVFLDGRKLTRPEKKSENQIEFEGIPAGKHKLRITHPTIADWERDVEVEGGATTPVTPNFVPAIANSEEFADTFLGGIMSWDAPKDWAAQPGKLTVRGAVAGIGLVKDKLYSNFRMEFDTKFLNGKGAVWIVRARDRQNYYMFQLMGPMSAGRNTFHSFICQNGQLRLLRPPEFLALDLSRPDDSFHIIVEARGTQIKHSIEISSAPAAGGPRPLSVITDGTIPQGTVGFGTKEREEFVVFYVNVTPLK